MRVCKVEDKREAWKKKRVSIVDQMRFMNISDQEEKEMSVEREYVYLDTNLNEPENRQINTEKRNFYHVKTPQ